MITPPPRGLEHPTVRSASNHDRRGRRPPAARQRVAPAAPARPTASSVTRDLRQVRASWTSRHSWFELVVGSHAAGLQVKLCSWLHTGTALEECFVIHTLAEFEQWLANAPTKFDHPIAHEEVRRFAHGNLAR